MKTAAEGMQRILDAGGFAETAEQAVGDAVRQANCLGGCFGVLVLDQARLIMLAALVLCVTGLLELEGGVFDADGAMAGDAGLQVVEQPGAVRRCRFPSGRKVADDPSCTAQLHTSRPRTVRPSRKPRLWGSRPGLNRLPPGAASRTVSANRFVSADG
jgi:hypothetical protein